MARLVKPFSKTSSVVSLSHSPLSWTNFIPINRSESIKSSKLQFFSDIHLERRTRIPEFNKCGKYCAVLGDIGNPFDDNYREFMYRLADTYEKSFIIAGNHEYWQSEPDKCYNTVNDQIESIIGKIPNIEFMNNSISRLEDYTIMGTTLWSKLSPSTKNIDGNNIFVVPKVRAEARHINFLHDKSVSWLKSCLNFYKNHKIIVLTHHLPSYQLIAQKYKTQKWKPYYHRYANHLNDLMLPNVHYWLCGHSHCQLEKEINGVKCLINSHGYPHEIPDFVEIRDQYIKL